MFIIIIKDDIVLWYSVFPFGRWGHLITGMVFSRSAVESVNTKYDQSVLISWLLHANVNDRPWHVYNIGIDNNIWDFPSIVSGSQWEVPCETTQNCKGNQTRKQEKTEKNCCNPRHNYARTWNRHHRHGWNGWSQPAWRRWHPVRQQV